MAYKNGYDAAEAAIGKTGQTGARRSTRVRDWIESSSVIESNCIVAIALPATSFDQSMGATGLIERSKDFNLRSGVSRGRSISLCGPRATAV